MESMNLQLKDSAISLMSGNVVSFPTETVYGLGVDAENESAVARMYEIKARPANHPVIIHISSKKLVPYWAREIPSYAVQLMEKFWPGPMTLLLKRTVTDSRRVRSSGVKGFSGSKS